MQENQQASFLLHTPELKVYADPYQHLIVIQAFGVVPTDVYRRGLSLAAETAISKHLLYWLVNNREGGIITPEDQIWTNEVIAPKLGNESSIIKMAFIEPEDCLSKIILEDMMDKARDIFPFEMQFLEDVTSALSWFSDTAATELSSPRPVPPTAF